MHELLEPLFIIAIGIIAGAINTIAGGGSLISLPVLIFLGLPGTVANGTNRVAIMVQNISAVGGFRSKGVTIPMPYSLYLGIASLVGGFIGAKLAVDIPDELFNRILAIVMILVVISIIAGRKKSTSVEEKMSRPRQVVGLIGFFFLGVYGGFIQAGIGFLVIALLTNVHAFSLIKTNYIKVFAALVYTGIAVVVFAFEDKIVWKTGLILAIGQGLGGWFASRWSVDKGEVWIKRVLVVIVIGLAVKLWFF